MGERGIAFSRGPSPTEIAEGWPSIEERLLTHGHAATRQPQSEVAQFHPKQADMLT